MKECIFIFLGGGIGSVMRYLVQLLINSRGNWAFPWPTWVANIAGCFLIGLFYAWSARFHWSTEMRLMLTTGLCGGFTTFSTFSNESINLLKTGNYSMMGIYLAVSIIIGLLAVYAGSKIGS